MHEEVTLMAWSGQANKSSSICLVLAWHEISFFICKDDSSSSLFSCNHSSSFTTVLHFHTIFGCHICFSGGFFQQFRTVVFGEELLQFIGLFVMYEHHIGCVAYWIASYVSQLNISNVPAPISAALDSIMSTTWASVVIILAIICNHGTTH